MADVFGDECARSSQKVGEVEWRVFCTGRRGIDAQLAERIEVEIAEARRLTAEELAARSLPVRLRDRHQVGEAPSCDQPDDEFSDEARSHRLVSQQALGLRAAFF